MIEIIVTGGIILVAAFFIYKHFKSASQGKCNCGCSSSACAHCSASSKKL